VTRVVAVFESPDAVERAVAASTRAGWRPITVCSPAFDEALLQLVGANRSPVAAGALAGGVVGVICGFVLTIGTVRQWPGLIVGGKPLVATPPFLLIVFELAILAASITAVVMFLFASKGARRAAGATCAGTTTDDRFALIVEAKSGSAEIDAVLRSAGAVEWRVL
jgi:hypothetical protein